MDWITTFIILGCNVLTVLICRYAYPVRNEYKDGMDTYSGMGSTEKRSTGSCGAKSKTVEMVSPCRFHLWSGNLFARSDLLGTFDHCMDCLDNSLYCRMLYTIGEDLQKNAPYKKGKSMVR